ncbi:putative abhydrolase domain-containing protein [Abeliophyllum distichum]|uniref:Abhydrolase domain-containing protein n=1 Tax=Abeliophyllum distichum TaxID=126358 RepID=A0ABD1RCV4_9LAMI
MVDEDLTKLGEAYMISADIELILPGPNERACFPRRGCTSLHLNAFVSGMRLPLHPMLRRILKAYDLAPTQHGNAFACVPNHLSAEEVAKEEGHEGRSMVRVFDDSEPDLDVPSVYGIVNSLPRCELSRDIVDIVWSIYQADPELRTDFE